MVPIKWGIGKITCEWVLIALKPPCKWTPGWMGEWQMDEQKKLCIFCIINFFLIFTMLVDFCHTNNANCTYLIIHTPPPSLASLPSPHPTPPGHHRAPDWAPRATQQLPTSYPSYLHLIVDATLLICWCYSLNFSHFCPPPRVRRSGRRGFQAWGCSLPDGRSMQAPTTGSSTGAKSKAISPYQGLEPQNHFISFQIPVRSGKQRQHKSCFIETRGPAANLPLPLCKPGQGI